MEQAKFSLTPSLIQFVNTYKDLGFKDKSSLVRAALEQFKEEVELRVLKESAALYAEIYDTDDEAKEWVEDSIQDWPE
ncbi:MAG: hypothetical protein QNJ45_19385 [Ardenticatenaceae bacterium]|nr:hypothetical protein [Ardenticatenaceae bacterium]